MFQLVGNNLALDLVDTVIVDNGASVDLLKGFDDLMDWSVAAGLLSNSDAAKAKRQWTGRREGRELFKKAIALRGSLKLMAEDLVHKRSVSKVSLAGINDVLKQKSGFFGVRRGENGYEKQFHAKHGDIFDLLVPVAESAVDLLCFGDLSQVKKCENETCILHFYDTSKNHGRRWCSMAVCGNRAKASSFYKRKIGRI